MPLKPHPTDPDLMVYVSRKYDIPELQGENVNRPMTKKEWLAYLKKAIDDFDWDAAFNDPQPEERNFCPRCGKRTPDLTAIHTCTPPADQTIPPGLFSGFMGGEQFMKDSMERNIT